MYVFIYIHTYTPMHMCVFVCVYISVCVRAHVSTRGVAVAELGILMRGFRKCRNATSGIFEQLLPLH